VAESVVGIVRHQGWVALGEDVDVVVGFEDDGVGWFGAAGSSGAVFQGRDLFHGGLLCCIVDAETYERGEGVLRR